ncbi:hypothetical protein LT493_10250 [Streptomyces tricolor]|nr:hypothetical protein [Streptomyces tricolor]
MLGVAVVQDGSPLRQHAAATAVSILHDAHRTIGASLNVRGATAGALADVVVHRFADAITVDVLVDAVRGAALPTEAGRRGRPAAPCRLPVGDRPRGADPPRRG